MNRSILMMALMMGSVMADPSVSIPTLNEHTPVKMSDGDVMRMMSSWKNVEKEIAKLQNDKTDPQEIMRMKRQNNYLKRKIDNLSQGNPTLESAWSKTQSDLKNFRDKVSLVQHPTDEREKNRSLVAGYYDDQLLELDAQLRLAEEAKAKRLQEIGMAGLQGTMDEGTKQRERASADKILADFRAVVNSERTRLQDEKAKELAKTK